MTMIDKEKLLNNITINPKTGCWEWRGSINNGYGRIAFDGKWHKAHRVSYTFFVGEIPEDLEVCHSCDNPICINPDHLWLGTHIDNIHDMWNKGRGKSPEWVGKSGEEHIGSKLTWKIVKKIRKLYVTGNHTQAQLGEMYGVSQTLISAIINRKIWINKNGR